MIVLRQMARPRSTPALQSGRLSFVDGVWGTSQRAQNGANLLLEDTSRARQRGPIYVFAKRTHRFLFVFWMEVVMNTLVAQETRDGNRWVRFGKRTHREASFGGVRLPQQLLCGICHGSTTSGVSSDSAPSDSVWKTNPPEGYFWVGFIEE